MEFQRSIKMRIILRKKKEGGEKVKDKIRILAEELFEDIQKSRNESIKEKEWIGMEIMALNALCNAEKTLAIRLF